MGDEIQAAKPFELTSHGDRFGWYQNHDGSWNHTLFISNGRVIDNEQTQIRSALKAIAQVHQGDYRITPNQNLTIAQVSDENKAAIDALLNQYVLKATPSATRQLAMACVALPTCSLAMAEAERYLPEFIGKVESIQDKHGILNRPISIRMTGCPNGCARPFVSEVGFIGKAPGRYNMYLGGQPNGNRLNQLYRENITETEILDSLDALIGEYANEANDNEAFGDFVVRKGHVKAVKHGIEVHLVD